MDFRVLKRVQLQNRFVFLPFMKVEEVSVVVGMLKKKLEKG